MTVQEELVDLPKDKWCINRQHKDNNHKNIHQIDQEIQEAI